VLEKRSGQDKRRGGTIRTSETEGAGKMAKISGRAATFAVLAAFTLTACEDGQFGTGTGSKTSVRAPEKPRVEIVEVERPDVFSARELALWDGRPSLGGIWIAHPDVTDPERVRITNTSSGQTITGALFRRERQNPGPRIQVSSDAAAALGVLAGQPTELSVVVLRQEEVTIEPETPVEEPEETTPDPEAGTEAEAATVAAAGAAAAPKKKPGFWASLRGAFGGKSATDIADEADTELLEASAPPAVETETLDPIEAAAAAIDEAEAEAASVAVAAPAPAPATAPAPVPVAASTLRNPYIQVGLFSQEANANSAAASLRQGGIVPTVVPLKNAQGNFWRVIVGPMSTTSDQAEVLAQVRSLGYSDAFLTSN
jgi:cell division septation protein DedD